MQIRDQKYLPRNSPVTSFVRILANIKDANIYRISQFKNASKIVNTQRNVQEVNSIVLCEMQLILLLPFRSSVLIQIVSVMVILHLLVLHSEAQVTFSRGWTPGKRGWLELSSEQHAMMKTATHLYRLLIVSVFLHEMKLKIVLMAHKVLAFAIFTVDYIN